MVKPLNRSKLKKLLALLGSNHDGEALSAARRIDEMVQASGLDWEALITPQPSTPDAQGDMKLLDELLAANTVSDILKLRLTTLRTAMAGGRLSAADRQYIRILHRKAVIDGVIVT